MEHGMQTPHQVRKAVRAAVIEAVSFSGSGVVFSICSSDRLIDDLGLSSLEVVELALHLEDVLGVQITNQAMDEVKTFFDLEKAFCDEHESKAQKI